MEHGHRHDYEAYYHPDVTKSARALGIKAVELRKCKTCGREMAFLLTDGDWFPLYEYREAAEQDILMA